MDEQDVLIRFLTGKMESKDFHAAVISSAALQERIAALVPQEAVHNREHPFWKNISYSGLETDGFDAWKHLCRLCDFDGSLGDSLNVFGSLKAMFKYYAPDLPYTTFYHDAYGLYLDAAQDCFDGPEVEHITESVIRNALPVMPKTKRIQTAKQQMKEAFHVTDRARPRWIQGPEWPMGQKSPMKFIEQRRKKEEVHYLFQDADSAETRTIIQYY